MKTLNTKTYALGFMTAMLALSVGCVVDAGSPGSTGGTVVTNPGCSAALVPFTNTTTEMVQIDFFALSAGASSDSLPLDAGRSLDESLAAGTYEIKVTGLTSGQVLQDQTVDLGCGETTANDAIFENSAELDLTNSSADDLWIYIDGELQNLLLAGDTAGYTMVAGVHQIKIEEANSGYILWDDATAADPNPYYAPGSVTPVTITANDADPIIELENDLPAGSDCLTAYVTSTLGGGAQSISFDNSIGTVTNEVCPGEVGYFAVTQGGWTLEFDDQQTGQVLYQATQNFYNNTDTPFQVTP